jgi:hypothetical protein
MVELFDFLWFLPPALAYYYLGLPLLVGLRQSYPAPPTLTELDFEELDPSLAEFLTTRTRTLFELGFDEPTLVHVPDGAPNVTAYLIMLINRRTGDKAMVTAFVARGLVPIQSLYVEFYTRFDTGEAFNTHNCRTLPAFPPAPLAVRTQAPSVDDPRELYRLHTFVMGKRDVRGKKLVYEKGQALDYLARFAFLKCYEEQVKRGWLRYDPESICYRPTFKGAYRVVWGLLQPFKALRTMALHRRARAILTEFHQACDAGRGSAHNEPDRS